MTQLKGFGYGVGIGAIALIVRYSPALSTSPAVPAAMFFGGIMVILAAILGFLQVFRRKSTFSPAADGFIYGFTGLFNILIVAADLMTGNWPDFLS
jgi:hypothetical protein